METTCKSFPTQMMRIIIIIIIIVHNVAFLMVGASTWEEVESFHAYEERSETKIQAVSGEDEREKKGALVLERFRTLLGLLSSKNKITESNEKSEQESPAPSPSPTATTAPTPAPVLAPLPVAHRHQHHHHQHHPHNRPFVLPVHELNGQHKESGMRREIILTVALCSGAALVLSALGILWLCRKLHEKKRRATQGVSFYGDQEGNWERSKGLALARKVRHDPGYDICYLNTTASNSQTQACLEGIHLSSNMSSVEKLDPATQEIKDSDHEASPQKTSTSSLAEEIISVHEYAESSKDESDGQETPDTAKVVENEADSSEDESFHSICDSRSSSTLRLSDASLGSFRDPVEDFTPDQSSRILDSPTATTPDSESCVYLPSTLASCNQEAAKTIAMSTKSTAGSIRSQYPPPPPPPPPLPPSYCQISPAYSPRKTPNRCHSSIARNNPSPRKLDPCPQSNQTQLGNNFTSPTPASMAPSNIPPPPCPPPFLNGKANSFKTPPPPPGQPPSFTALGKDGAPLPKLKPLHWDKVRATPDRSMVWDKLRCSSFELDEEMIESLFGYSLKTVFNNEEGKNKSPSPNNHVLEPKRLQNITILSKALNVTAEKVCEAIMQGDGLCSQQLEALVKMAPTKDEEAKLSSYKRDINELGSAEKLVKEMLTIPYAFQRIEAMLYRATFHDEVVYLRNSFSMLEEACKELRSSRLFLKLLEAVLKTGNRMNVGTIRGGAKAFKLDALLKLADVKGTDGKTNLLHFVVQEIIRSEGIRMSDSIMGQIGRSSKSRTDEENEDDYRTMGLELVCGLSTELCNVKRTASIDLDVLAISVSNLTQGMSKLQQLVNKDLLKDARNDNFVHTMKTFLSHAEKNLTELQAEENKVFLSVREITEYYHGDVSKEEANPLRIFVIVRDFLGMLDQVCRELKSLKTPKTPKTPNPLAPFR